MPPTLTRLALCALALVLSALAGAAGMWAHMSPKVAVAEERADALAGTVREQNKAVQGLREAEAKRKAEADARVAAAAAVAQTAERQAQALLAMTKPQGVGECEAAQALIARELSK